MGSLQSRFVLTPGQEAQKAKKKVAASLLFEEKAKKEGDGEGKGPHIPADPSQFIFQTVSSQSHHPGTFFLGAVDYHLGLAETSEEGRSRTVQYGAGIRESRENSAWAAQPTQWFSGW